MGLSPVTRDPYPAGAPAHPVTFNPHSRWSWTGHPAAAHPDVIRSGPAPIPRRPDISGPRRDCLRLDPNRRRSRGHENLSRDRLRHDLSSNSSRGRCRYPSRSFGCRCCRRYRHRFLGAADQRKRCQRQYVKTYSHICFLFMESFCVSSLALFEFASRIFHSSITLRAIDSEK